MEVYEPNENTDSSDSDSSTYSEFADEPKAKRHKCTFQDCNKAFYRPCRLTEHLRLHTEERPYHCEEPGCEKTYHKKSSLKRHQQTFHLKDVENTMCPIEGCLQVMRKNSLKKHIIRKHNSLRKFKYHCPECNEGFRNESEMHNHCTVHADIYKCHICGKVFDKGSRFRYHIKHHKHYTCICLEEFYDINKFRTHKKHCNICHELYLRCDVCLKIFSSDSNLKEHIKHVHAPWDTLETYKCSHEGCTREYSHLRNLTKHIKDHHSLKKDASVVHVCDDCHKIFKTKRTLKRHREKLHVNSKPPTTKTRLKRWDIGIPKKPMITSLTGVEIPANVNKTRILLEKTALLKKDQEESRVDDSSKPSDAPGSCENIETDTVDKNFVMKEISTPDLQTLIIINSCTKVTDGSVIDSTGEKGVSRGFKEQIMMSDLDILIEKRTEKSVESDVSEKLLKGCKSIDSSEVESDERVLSVQLKQNIVEPIETIYFPETSDHVEDSTTITVPCDSHVPTETVYDMKITDSCNDEGTKEKTIFIELRDENVMDSSEVDSFVTSEEMNCSDSNHDCNIDKTREPLVSIEKMSMKEGLCVPTKSMNSSGNIFSSEIDEITEQSSIEKIGPEQINYTKNIFDIDETEEQSSIEKVRMKDVPTETNLASETNDTRDIDQATQEQASNEEPLSPLYPIFVKCEAPRTYSIKTKKKLL